MQDIDNSYIIAQDNCACYVK